MWRTGERRTGQPAVYEPRVEAGALGCVVAREELGPHLVRVRVRVRGRVRGRVGVRVRVRVRARVRVGVRVSSARRAGPAPGEG